MSVALVYNPRAGTILRRPELRADVVAALEESFGAVEAVATTGPGTAGAMAREAAGRGAASVIVWGGDGTVNEAAQALEGSGVALGVIPGGTASVLARELGFGGDPRRAARMLGGCVPRDVAAGALTRPDGSRRLFLLMAGIGFDARVVHALDLELKDRVGKLAYWAGALGQLGARLDEVEIETDGARRRCSFALVSRVRNYGGDVELTRAASILSDSFELLLFEGRSVIRYPFYFLSILLGQAKRTPGLTALSATRVEAKPPAGEQAAHVQIDGEYAGTIPATFEIVPRAIRLLVPATFKG